MIMRPDKRIYLASRSPRRRELLKQIGVNFELLLLREDPGRGPDVDETPQVAEGPEQFVRRVALSKVDAGWRRINERRLPRLLQRLPLLAADTAVVLDERIIGKPLGPEHAVEILKRLSGRTHQVMSAVAVAFDDRVEMALSVSSVEFGKLRDDDIRHYVATGEPLDKAGAYAIQGRGAAFVTRLEGSYSGVVGLPLYETAQLLRGFGLELP